MKARKQTRYTTTPEVIVYTGRGNFHTSLEGQYEQAMEAVKIIVSKKHLNEIASKSGFTMRQDSTSSLCIYISAEAYNQQAGKL